MNTDVETQLRDYWGAVSEASATLAADDVRIRPVQVDGPSPRRAPAWSPAWAMGLAALVVVVLIGGAAVLFGSRTSTEPADEPETNSDLLLDFPTSEIPPFRAEVRLADPRTAKEILNEPGDIFPPLAEVFITVSYGGQGLFRVDVTQEIPRITDFPAAAAAAGSFTVIRDNEVVEYSAGENHALLIPADLSYGEREPFPFVWESWDDLCTFGEHEFLEPEPVTGRNTIRLRCTKGSDTYELWVDAETGLLLRVAGTDLPSIAMPTWVEAVEYEVISVEYEPRFADGLFDLTVPQGATVDTGERGNEPAPLEIGQTAPGLEGTSLDSDEFDLTELRGERIAILFWGTACQPCLDALDDVALVAEVTENVVFVTALHPDIANNARTALDEARTALDERGIDLLVIELAGYGDSSMRAWGISGVPTLVFVDRDGTVAGSVRGYGPLDTIEGLLHDAGW